MGFAEDARSMEVEIDPSKRAKGLPLRDAVMGLESSPRNSARSILFAVSYFPAADLRREGFAASGVRGTS